MLIYAWNTLAFYCTMKEHDVDDEYCDDELFHFTLFVNLQERKCVFLLELDVVPIFVFLLVYFKMLDARIVIPDGLAHDFHISLVLPSV